MLKCTNVADLIKKTRYCQHSFRTQWKLCCVTKKCGHNAIENISFCALCYWKYIILYI